MAVVVGTEDGDRLDGSIEADVVSGGGGNDTIRGDGFAPGISGGGSGVDLYLGGDDTILGGEGDDWLSGGHGADHLWGGEGADRFAFGTHIPIDPFYITPEIHVLDTGVGKGARDVVHDFEQGTDRIDLSLLLTLGYRHLDIDEAYEFIGADPFSGERAQVRYEVDEVNGRTVVQLDGTDFASGEVRNVDRLVDAEIEIAGAIRLLGSDFTL